MDDRQFTQRALDCQRKLYRVALSMLRCDADAADKARAQAEAAFSDDAGNMPCKEIPFSANIIDVLTLSEVAKSRGDARRLIDGGGVSVNELKITDYGDLPSEITEKREFVLHKGKKVHLRIVLK